jgi:molybdopterin molybdotransferase
MISVQDGQNQILRQLTEPTPPEVVAVTRARDRVLAEDLPAPFDVPPADNSAVDGYAVASDDVPAATTRELAVIAELAAGTVFAGTVASGQTVRIMTGAPMPRGADTVYPQEVVERRGDRLKVGSISKGANVRKRGEDVQAGTIAIERGTVLRPQELGLITSLGQWQVLVHRRPRVALLSTGDEVVEPGTPRKPGQIYDANRFTLRGSVEQCGGEVIDLGIVADARDELRTRLLEAAGIGDIVVTSGGVSVGAHDLVKDVLGEIGAIDFWQVAMQPGRPLAFGRIGSAHFFGLPGNPVASMLAFMLFVRPGDLQAGRPAPPVPRDGRGDGGRDHEQEEGPPRVQARRRPLEERPLGGADDGTAGFRYPLLDGGGQLPDRARRRARRRGGR